MPCNDTIMTYKVEIFPQVNPEILSINFNSTHLILDSSLALQPQVYLLTVTGTIDILQISNQSLLTLNAKVYKDKNQEFINAMSVPPAFITPLIDKLVVTQGYHKVYCLP